MPVVMSYQGGVDALAILTAAWWLHLRIGLYVNDWTPQNYQPDSAIVPATFSGYPGLLPVSGWGAPVQVGAQAVTTAPEFVWTHDGGAVQQTVYGVYLVNDSGLWVFAERISELGIPMFSAGHYLAYTPRIAAQSIFASW